AGGVAMGVAAASASVSPQDDGDWWEQVVFAVDNSKSMEGAELEAVKTVLKEQVHDLATENPEGVEMRLDTFDESGNNRTAFANQFFPEAVVPIINGLATSGAADPGCAVNSLAALTRAIGNRSRLDAWLFTDGTPYVLPGAESMRQFLADRSARASIALLGNCPVVTAQAVSASPPLGLARAYLGLAADETPGGIVPYLITAIASGGQFLYGTSDNAQDLADILRAQISHSAGAGRWSDYVSDVYTYRHDRLASWEYQDIDATTGYDAVVDPAGDGTESIALPQGFTFYGSSEPATSVEVYQNGYVTLQASPNFVGDADWTENRPVPDPSPPLDAPSWPHRALYAYWDDLEVSPGPRSAMDVQAPQADFFGAVFGKRAGDWYVIQYEGFKVYQLASQNLDFQILLNLRNGEIRYQYLDVPNEGAASATIGLEGNSGFGFGQGVQVSYNDISGAADRTGYKFTPAPPQPTKSYSVTVDSSMQGIAFLLTGYSGSFEPLVVREPGGTQVACDAAGVLCLNLGLVQYVQANVDGRVGTWTATVDAGPTGSGTFSFTSFAASALALRSSGDHSLSSVDASRPILVDLGRTVNGNEITGWFTEPNGAIFNGDFPLYDDGAHGDGAASDGLFGSFPFGPGHAGTAYLWVRKMRGEEEQFRRVDPVPYTFQPLRVTLAPSEVPNYGYYSDFTLTIENHDSVNH
ncbi:MAG TPA: vWA domain-containing protein, partial [Ardenticatenaceae bacterium]|nr:vWA domain-containing protein [Ardenticatenaceae bacterium]